MGNLEFIRSEAARVEEDAEHNSIQHFIQGELYSKISFVLGLVTLAATAVTALLTFSPFALPAQIAGSIAFVLTFFMLYVRPGERAEEHYRCGGRWKELRHLARCFREGDIESATQEEETALKERLGRLTDARRLIGESGVPLTQRSYRLALERISGGSTAYAIDGGKSMARSGLDISKPSPPVESPNESR